MYLRRIHIRHVKRLRDFALDFLHDGEPRMWTVLIGENGTAKTSLLQAVALAAAGSKQINTLAGPVVKHFRDRRSTERLEVTATFEMTPSARRLPSVQGAGLARPGVTSTFSLAPGSTSFDASARFCEVTATAPARLASGEHEKDPLDAARDTHERLWFVAGYGVSRVLPDPSSTPPLDRPSIERLTPLFASQATLTSTSFSNHFLRKDRDEGRRAGTTSRLYGRILNNTLKIGGADLLPDVDRIELRGQGGATTAGDLIESDRFRLRMGKDTHKIAGVALSHGYQSTFAWIADLIGHILLESSDEVASTDMEGLVLIDEIDLYLHPTWQARFVTALRRIFPKIQFIVTTHSPVVLAGVAPHEVVRLMVDPETGDVERGGWDAGTGAFIATSEPGEPSQPDPRPMTGSELYRIWFGLDRLTPNPHGAALREYLVLAGDPSRTRVDEARMKALVDELCAAGFADLPRAVSAPRR